MCTAAYQFRESQWLMKKIYYFQLKKIFIFSYINIPIAYIWCATLLPTGLLQLQWRKPLKNQKEL